MTTYISGDDSAATGYSNMTTIRGALGPPPIDWAFVGYNLGGTLWEAATDRPAVQPAPAPVSPGISPLLFAGAALAAFLLLK